MCSEVFVKCWSYVQKVTPGHVCKAILEVFMCGQSCVPCSLPDEVRQRISLGHPLLLIMGLWAKTQDRRLSKSGEHYYPWKEWLPLSPHKCKFPSHPHKGPIHILSPTDIRSLNERIPPDTTRIYPGQSPGNSCLAFLLALHPQVSHQPGRFLGGVVATISCFSLVHYSTFHGPLLEADINPQSDGFPCPFSFNLLDTRILTIELIQGKCIGMA